MLENVLLHTWSKMFELLFLFLSIVQADVILYFPGPGTPAYLYFDSLVGALSFLRPGSL